MVKCIKSERWFRAVMMQLPKNKGLIPADCKVTGSVKLGFKIDSFSLSLTHARTHIILL